MATFSSTVGNTLGFHAPGRGQRLSCTKNAARMHRSVGLQRVRDTQCSALAMPSDRTSASDDEQFPTNFVTCKLQDDGTLVCERLAPGKYQVKSSEPTWNSSAFCSFENASDCVTYCQLDDNGQLVCEGLPDGSYEVRTAGETDVSGMVEHIWSMRTYAEDDAEDQP